MYEVNTGTIPRNLLPPNPRDLLITHPRAVTNAYQFLEGTSMLAYVAMHPNDFPIGVHHHRLHR